MFYLDIGPKFAADAQQGSHTRPLHLNAKSYETWAEAIEPMVAKLMGEADNHPGATVMPAPPKSVLHRRVHEKINARVKQGHVDLIFLGDSITHFWTSEGYWKNDGTEVWNKFYGKRNAVNMGVRGDWTQHVLWRLDHGNIDGIAPKLAVLMIGTNPIGVDPPEDVAEGVKAIVEKLRAKLPQTKVLLLGLLPRGETQEDRFRQLTTKTNEIISVSRRQNGVLSRHRSKVPQLRRTLDKRDSARPGPSERQGLRDLGRSDRADGEADGGEVAATGNHASNPPFQGGATAAMVLGMLWWRNLRGHSGVKGAVS